MDPAPSNDAQPSVSRAWPDADFETVYREHSRSIYYLALRYLGNESQAEDATHDVFLKAWRKFGEFRGQSAIRTWLYRITINHCQNLLQTWHNRNVHSNADEFLMDSQTSESCPLRVLETKELGERIQRAMTALTDEYRLLLLLVADEKLSYEEVGELTGQTADAVRGKLHRARKSFSAAFNQTA